MERVCGDERLVRTLGAVDPAYRAWCTDLAGECAALRPDVVHAWLDHANIWAGIAARTDWRGEWLIFWAALQR